MTRTAFEQEVLRDGIGVAVDLSSSQYLAVTQNSSGKAALPTIKGEQCYGLLANAPTVAQDDADVILWGIAPGKLGGTVSYDDNLTCAVGGALIKSTDSTDYIVCRALTSGSSGTTIPVWVGSPSPIRDIAEYEINFDQGAAKGLAILAQAEMAAYSATAGDFNLMHFHNGYKLGVYPIVGQTIPPAMAAAGLDIQGDQVAADGFDIVGGIGGASGRPLIAQVDPAFYFECQINIADVSGTDELHVGLRRAETLNATWDNYLDTAGLGCNSSAADMAIKIETILNNAGTTSTDTTDEVADGVDVTFKIFVSAAGVVTYTINGSAPTVTAAFTFDAGDPLIPYLHYLQHGDFTEAFLIKKWSVGFQ